MAKQEEDEITYFVERNNGQDQKVTVPASWKVTFGPQNPGVKGAGPSGEPCLRFYKSANQQRMVITGVKSFRDMSIVIEEKRTTVKEERYRKADTDGEDKVVVMNASMEEWINPDKPRPASPQYRMIGEPKAVKDEDRMVQAFENESED